MPTIAKAHLVPCLFLLTGLVFFIADLVYSDRYEWHVRPDGSEWFPVGPETILSWSDERWDSDQAEKLGMGGARVFMLMLLRTTFLFLPVFILMLSTLIVKRPCSFLARFYNCLMIIFSFLLAIFAFCTLYICYDESKEYKRNTEEWKNVIIILKTLAKGDDAELHQLDLMLKYHQNVGKYHDKREFLTTTSVVLTYLGLLFALAKSRWVQNYFATSEPAPAAAVATVYSNVVPVTAVQVPGIPLGVVQVAPPTV
jgi:hypothetical protein